MALTAEPKANLLSAKPFGHYRCEKSRNFRALFKAANLPAVPRVRVPSPPASPRNRGSLKRKGECASSRGWHLASELLTREKKHIIDGMLVLEAGEAKNEQPRRFPLDIIPELGETIEQQLAATRSLEVETGRVITLLFHNRGNPIVDYRPAWNKACVSAGLSGRLVHDFRRTAARNLINAGVDPLTTMRLVGWEDIAMLKRYNIINDEILRVGVTRLGEHLARQMQRARKVTAFRR